MSEDFSIRPIPRGCKLDPGGRWAAENTPPDQLIVGMIQCFEISREDLEAQLQALGGRLMSYSGVSRIHTFEIPAGKLTALNTIDDINYIEVGSTFWSV
jgi:hypothetical protein